MASRDWPGPVANTPYAARARGVRHCAPNDGHHMSCADHGVAGVAAWAPRRRGHTVGQGNEDGGITVRWGSVRWQGHTGAVAVDNGVR
jgi:hypothetical protein